MKTARRLPETSDFRLVRCDEDGRPEAPVDVGAPEIRRACEATCALYRRTGWVAPWVSYVSVCGETAVGGGAFHGPPAYGRVEIAYFTLPDFQGRGFGARTARRLLDLAREADPDIAVWAKTLPQETASTAILRRLGFEMIGSTTDEDVGEAWRWLHL
jgi:RimJ/RimL family protein N-acetyltransferase